MESNTLITSILIGTMGGVISMLVWLVRKQAADIHKFMRGEIGQLEKTVAMLVKDNQRLAAEVHSLKEEVWSLRSLLDLKKEDGKNYAQRRNSV